MPNRRLGNLNDTLQAANGAPAWAGTLASSGAAVSNSSTAAPFSLHVGEWLMVQPDAPGYVGFGVDSASAITAASNTNGVYLAGNEKFSCVLPHQWAYVAFTPASGSANLKVWTQS